MSLIDSLMKRRPTSTEAFAAIRESCNERTDELELEVANDLNEADRLDKAFLERSEACYRLLPIEEATRDRLLDEIKEIRWHARFLRQSEDALTVRELGYFPLSLEPLRWRNRNGLPLLAVYRPDSPWFAFSTKSSCYVDVRGRTFSLPYQDSEWRRSTRWPAASQKSSVKRWPEPPPLIADFYNDVAALVEAKQTNFFDRFVRIEERDVTFFSMFEKVIPDDVRTKITAAGNALKSLKSFHGIFIVAEANWGVSVVPKPDPLVVAFAAKRMWLIAAFDLTDLEFHTVFHP